MKEIINKYKKTACLVAAGLFALVSIGTVIYYIAFPSTAYMHADCTDTLLWAKASIDSGKLFNPDFGYAALLPFGGTTIMMPLVALFGYTLSAQKAGMIIFAFLFFAAVWSLCISLDFSHAFSLFITGSMAAVLASSEKMREIFYEHVLYYSICILAICVLMSVIIDISKKKKIIVSLVVLTVFTALFALDGMQVLATGVFPVLFGAVMYLLLENRKIFSKENKKLIFGIVFIGIGALIGFIILQILTKEINAGYADAYSSFSAIEEWTNNLLKFPQQWFELFGVDVIRSEKIFSFRSILNIIRIVTATAVCIVPFAGLFLYKKLGKGSKILLFAHFGLTGVILFGYVFGILSAANWRLSPLICTGVLVSAAVLNCIKESLSGKRIVALFCTLLILASIIPIANIIRMPKNGKEANPYYGITQQLIKSGLKTGYATFWNSQVITLLSDSKLQVANIDVNENGISPCMYQTDKKWFDAREGEENYFLLLTPNEVNTVMQTADYDKFKRMMKGIIVTDYGFTIFIYGSPDVIK